MMKRAKDSLDLGVIVSDIKASLNFYQEFLGLEFIGEMPLPFGTMYRMRYGTSDFKLVLPDKMPEKGKVGLVSQLGLRYVTFAIENLTDVCDLLKDKDVEFVMDVTELRPGVTIAMVKDPDENIVEFVQYT